MQGPLYENMDMQIYCVRQRRRNNRRGLFKPLMQTYSLPAINNAINVEHGHDLEDKSFSKMTGCIEVAH